MALAFTAPLSVSISPKAEHSRPNLSIPKCTSGSDSNSPKVAPINVVSAPLRKRLAALNRQHTKLTHKKERKEGIILVGLVGVPGSGKSSVGLRATHDANVPLLTMDGFHLARKYLDADGLARRGAPSTFDVNSFVKFLRIVRSGGRPKVPTFDHSIGDPVLGDELNTKGCGVILVEGNYLLHWDEARNLLDECWYLDTPMDVAMHRVLHRLIRDIGFPLDEAEHRVRANDAQNALLVHKTRSLADYVLDSTTGIVYPQG